MFDYKQQRTFLFLKKKRLLKQVVFFNVFKNDVTLLFALTIQKIDLNEEE